MTIVVPAYNEQEVLVDFHNRLTAAVTPMGISWKVLYINDGSTDDTLSIFLEIQDKFQNVSVMDLSRNFGKEAALTAGLDHAKGETVVVIDADLQDPPEIIPELYAKLNEGFDAVYAKRRSRQGETWLKKTTANLFYTVLDKIGDHRIPKNVGDFRIMSRRAVDALCTLRETDRFMKGLFAWIGFKQTCVEYDRHPRKSGETCWTYWKLWNFALDGITSFSILPLKFATYIGLGMSMISLLYGLVIVLKKLFLGNPVPGYPSLMASILFLGGIQLFFLGVIGEYLGRLFRQIKNRPLYFINKFHE